MFLSPTSYSTVRPSCYCPNFAHPPFLVPHPPFLVALQGVIYVAATTGLWPLTKHSRTFNHSTRSLPGLSNSSPDKSRIGNPFVWAALLILSLRNTHLRISSNYCLLAFGLRSVWCDQTAMHVMTAPAPDCRIPKGTVYFFPTSVVEWLNDQILDPDSPGSNLCPHNLVIARSLVSLSQLTLL